MSENEPNVPMTTIESRVPMLFDPEQMAQLDRSCELARSKQLNKNEVTPNLKALADKWKTMDRFSKRELGGHDVKPPEQIPTQTMPVTAQLGPGQVATVTGPSTVYGGNITIVNGDKNAEQEQSTGEVRSGPSK